MEGTIFDLLDELRNRLDKIIHRGHREAYDRLSEQEGAKMGDRIRKAVEVLGASGKMPSSYEELARALDAAGLLRTGMEQEACEACVRLDAFPAFDPRSGAPDGFWSVVNGARDVGHRIAESRKPRERWRVLYNAPAASWYVAGGDVPQFLGTEAECRAVAEALNKLEAGR